MTLPFYFYMNMIILSTIIQLKINLLFIQALKLIEKIFSSLVFMNYDNRYDLLDRFINKKILHSLKNALKTCQWFELYILSQEYSWLSEANFNLHQAKYLIDKIKYFKLSHDINFIEPSTFKSIHLRLINIKLDIKDIKDIKTCKYPTMMQNTALKNLKIMLAIGVGFLVLGVILVIVSVVTLSKDNDLQCSSFKTGVCAGYSLTQDETFCCGYSSIICYAKFYCNGDEFIVNGLRYIGIASIVGGIITSIIFCVRRKRITNDLYLRQQAWFWICDLCKISLRFDRY